MTTDFSSLVLGPCMAIFGIPVQVSPKVSIPTAAPYSTNAGGGPVGGVFSVSVTEIPTDDGGLFPVTTLKFGIRLADFPTMPLQGDWITIDSKWVPLNYWQGLTVPTGPIDFLIYSILPDGQGGAVAQLKRVTQ